MTKSIREFTAEEEEAARQERNKAQRAWRRANPEKCRQYAMNYWLKKSLKSAEQDAAKH